MSYGLIPVLLWLALALAPAPAHPEVPVPALSGRVTDLTGTLDSSAQASLENRLRAFELKHGSQIAVLIVPTTEPETIEQYSMRVAEAWKLGRKGVDDGALLLVATKDRTMRIEVGYGLEGALNDATCKRIISETITPEFRRGNFAAGIEAGIDQMIRVIEGEALPTPAPSATGRGSGDISPLLFFLAFLALGATSALRPFLGRLGAALLVGLGTTLVASFLVSAWVALLIGAVVFVLALFGAPTGSWSSRRRYSPGGGGGFGGGGFGGGGGGFRGGGGGFGGGGASGRW